MPVNREATPAMPVLRSSSMASNVGDIRNIAVCGHGSSGKTMLVDHLLVKTGAVTGQPSVDNGTSISDFDEEEKHHKHSVEASIVHFDHGRGGRAEDEF